ncbi:DUF1656 domain-containing protein [Ancylobacter mangrovi]|uniref:DUF1656 domain-containing protein n=1 Tax=Ancylobacter mangrovi TaxID=2972472 RepID=A0A9X2PDR8_9HYPH|nr:DUF1656 domain-containing protein [Ancylobacter mangrovi]MCS0496826.1 DUF1656 domain-containing protein [Ancylobacter mangrovi]MCS0504827.1 DUF1656 domain-containing protein [Ancylobacter mangrovi]
MSGEIDVYGVYIPNLLALMLLTLPVSLLLRRGLARLGAYAFVWHRGLFDVALYVLLLQGMSLLSQWWLS